MATRCYVDGKVTDDYLANKLDLGMVMTDHIPNRHLGGDVAYFREGAPEEIERCRELLEKKKAQQDRTFQGRKPR